MYALGTSSNRKQRQKLVKYKEMERPTTDKREYVWLAMGTATIGYV